MTVDVADSGPFHDVHTRAEKGSASRSPWSTSPISEQGPWYPGPWRLLALEAVPGRDDKYSYLASVTAVTSAGGSSRDGRRSSWSVGLFCESPGFGMQACPGTLFQPTATLPSPGCYTQFGFAGQQRERADLQLMRPLATPDVSIILITASARSRDIPAAGVYPAS
ncbi:hypothetical protein OIDMADRAFT_47773 [Oidiodendron maius Zn]|uniref:Uncharacterized protein n=1 Tax=Oidiodendron maius (strain Zn) TaxID=913774 RepID=A0A0C3E0N5_OIDMZ|nr:hypothetical protein OIDMADRAFT_47773 [Oidiodendron maius Zn]